MPKPSISFYTLGCRLNQSETAVIRHSLEREGYPIVDFDDRADVVVINTCTVTENGDADTRQLVNRVNRLNPRVRIALVGCQAQIQKEKLTQLPNVHWVIGNAKKMELASIFKETMDTVHSPCVMAPPIPKEAFTIPPAGNDPNHTRANIKIQDGCDFFCSFCEIPYARGRARSRQFEDILLEAAALAAAGHQELVLTGINLGTYDYEQKKLLDVIGALEEVPGIKRLRISSIEPTTIPWALFEKMAERDSRLCRHLHIPIQSGNDEILNAMKRKYTVKEFADFVARVTKAIPEICLGTDVIVGFPGETEEDFAETYALLRDLPFSYFHVFSYSRRSLAQSRRMTDFLDPETIKSRSEQLRILSVRKREIFFQKMIGSQQTVLIEQKKEGFWSGLTDNYVRVKLAGNRDLHNCFIRAEMIKTEGPYILGRLMEES